MTIDSIGKRQRKEREFRFRRGQILETAVKLFAARGFHETTMAGIAAASGFSIGGLYRFFSGKEQLYSDLVLEKVCSMYDEIMAAADREDSTEGRIRALVAAHFSYVEHHIDFYRLLVGHESGLRAHGLRALRERILEEHRKHVDRIEGILREGVLRRDLRELDTGSLADALIGMVAYAKFAWIMSPRGESLSNRADDVLELFLRGAARAPGDRAGSRRAAEDNTVYREEE
jgi:AcrR family transcriptional regulator